MILLIQPDPECPPGILLPLLAGRKRAYCLVSPGSGDTLPEDGFAAVIVLGGYMGVEDEDRFPFLAPLKAWLGRQVSAGIPVLGICLGGQLLARVLGGSFYSGQRGERGVCSLTLTEEGRNDPLFAGLSESLEFFQWHNDCFDPPPQGRLLAGSERCPGQAFRCGSAWGVQFHPEVDLAIVENWSRLQGDPATAAAFAATADAHQARAGRLLDNFLRTAVGGYAKETI